ncbi:response regulator [Geomonas subterranea]|uniref:Response regulator n=1 Tax=Geomonas subterranea TaxID=2847989 RepID=A0ABX8LI82_9BACT|nr:MULTISPECIES: response regulator [Geomonas]QXE91031.1 response regulator [Geomonas subterranea]QXM10884.1 response regulator [Geomonas subterranea]
MLKKVLVVDDSEMIHKMYRLVLNRYGCEIIDAMDGQQALDLLERHQGIQLILLDINMPVMNGVQFLEKAGALGITKRIPVVIISTEGKEGDTIRGLQLGAKGYVKKPFNPTLLHEMIDKLELPPAEVSTFVECRAANTL